MTHRDPKVRTAELHGEIDFDSDVYYAYEVYFNGRPVADVSGGRVGIYGWIRRLDTVTRGRVELVHKATGVVYR